MDSTKWLLPCIIALLLACSPVPAAPTDEDAGEPLVVFLVRHAEKSVSNVRAREQVKDPALTSAGRERTDALATMLRSAELNHVHSSDYTRTRDTAAPVAAAFDLDVELYDPRDLDAIAAHLRAVGGRHLVVGHSNTTPALVKLLGGDPGHEIDEASEYDRLYIVTIGKDGVASSVLLRYGAPYTP